MDTPAPSAKMLRTEDMDKSATAHGSYEMRRFRFAARSAILARSLARCSKSEMVSFESLYSRSAKARQRKRGQRTLIRSAAQRRQDCRLLRASARLSSRLSEPSVATLSMSAERTPFPPVLGQDDKHRAHKAANAPLEVSRPSFELREWLQDGDAETKLVTSTSLSGAHLLRHPIERLPDFFFFEWIGLRRRPSCSFAGGERFEGRVLVQRPSEEVVEAELDLAVDTSFGCCFELVRKSMRGVHAE